MKVRSESEIVSNTLKILEESEKLNLHIAERVESNMSVNKLRKLLMPFAKSARNAEQENLDELKDFLRERSERIMRTSVLYCYQPATLVNRACIALAQDLAQLFPYRVLKLLLPKVIIPANFESKHFNNFIITEDSYLIPISQAFNDLRNDPNHKFEHPAKRKMEKEEYERFYDLLTGYSSTALHYALEINSLFRSPSENEIEQCNKIRDELIDEFEKINYHRATPAYKDASHHELMLSLTKNVKTLQALAEFMAEHVAKNDWDDFLQNMDKEELYRIVLPYRTRSMQKPKQPDEQYQKEQCNFASLAMDDLLNSAVPLPETNTAKRAQQYILAFLQHQFRNERDANYTSWTSSMVGRAGSSFFWPEK